jgi:threonine/homoserine/homoserine lactone efflux protein
MSLASLLVFAAAYLAVVILPGAAVTALVARVLARGPAGAPSFTAGIAFGSVLWFTVAATGLAAVAASFAGALVAIRYAGACYLLYLAWKLWHAAARPVEARDGMPGSALSLFLTGLSLQLGNPKAVMFFLALLPTVIDLEALTLAGFAELCAVIVIIVGGVFGAYAIAAARARRLLTSPRALRAVNRGSSLAMAGAAAAIAAR